jgi:alkylation response protein AidB-like acyl-CoA dehydrogenase
MDFRLTDEQRMLQDTVARLMREQYAFETRQKLTESEDGFSREIWAQYAELGLLAIGLSEEAGGFGGAIELMLVAQELGRGLALEPFLATVVLGGSLIDAAGSAAQKEDLLGRLVGGELLLAFAHGEPQSRYSLTEVQTRAERSGDGWQLSGHKAVVLHGDTADLLIVSARVGGDIRDRDGIGLFLVDPKADGVRVRGYQTIDGLRAAEVFLDGVQVGSDAGLGEPGKAYPAIEYAVGRGVVALCAEAVGAMEVTNEFTLDYLKTRKQFGVPIGKFQVLQHRMVDMQIALEQSRSMAILVASRLEAEEAERERAVSAAKHYIGKAGRFISEQAIQLHGGIGMTWEYAMAHYAKRLVMIDHQLGDTEFHLERFAALMQTTDETAA